MWQRRVESHPLAAIIASSATPCGGCFTVASAKA
jgi:hypothetical protein